MPNALECRIFLYLRNIVKDVFRRPQKPFFHGVPSGKLGEIRTPMSGRDSSELRPLNPQAPLPSVCLLLPGLTMIKSRLRVIV
jgi:hypothetical protein